MTPSREQPDLDALRWAALIARDIAADFRYAVKTTGVYCRPGCASRRPLRENVEFFDTSDDARRAGYRACKRCRPDETDDGPRVEIVREACRAIESAHDQPPSLEELADRAGTSPRTLRRAFRACCGLTPKQYGDAIRSTRVRELLAGGVSVTEALYAAGYGSAGRFYASSSRDLGMKPAAYARGGRGESIRFAITDTALGRMLVALTDVGVCCIAFAGDARTLEDELRQRFPGAAISPADDEERTLVADVAGRIDAAGPLDGLPLDIRGTAFRRRVWAALQAIPAGETRTYSEVAQAIGQPAAVRAVASACANNAIAVAIPCHRVVRRDGSMGGYRWGVERKRKLLEREDGR